MRHALALGALMMAALAVAATPAAAQTVEELKAQLKAQKTINALQKQRIETLEAELAGRKIPPPPRASGAEPPISTEDPENQRALERALVRRGSAVLPSGSIEVTPSLSWTHSGRDALTTTQDTYGTALDIRGGLPDGWMIGATVPFYRRSIDSVGTNTGLGDVSATVWKSLFAQSDARPSLVASVNYGAPTGENIGETRVPLGSGFHRITGQLSSVKSFDPIAFYGNVSYTHYLAEDIPGMNVERSDAFGFGLGANLVATPDITVSNEFDFSFEGQAKINGQTVNGSGTTVGMYQVGAGIVLTRNVFLTFTGGVGITGDSPDVVLATSLPVRF